MNDVWRWQDALNAAEVVGRHERDRWALRTLAELPFLSEEILEQLAGLKRRCLHSTVARFMRSGLVAAINPPLQPGHSPRLLYLTDLGVAACALLEEMAPVPYARRRGITRPRLIRLLPALPLLQDTYRLLGAVATINGVATIVQWESPWRRCSQLPAAKNPAFVHLPAFAELVWDGRRVECLLVPDRGQLPLRAYGPALRYLLAIQAQGGVPPALVVATNEGRRMRAWHDALRAAAEAQNEARLPAVIASWADLPGGPFQPNSLAWGRETSSTPSATEPTLPEP